MSNHADETNLVSQWLARNSSFSQEAPSRALGSVAVSSRATGPDKPEGAGMSGMIQKRYVIGNARVEVLSQSKQLKQMRDESKPVSPEQAPMDAYLSLMEEARRGASFVPEQVQVKQGNLGLRPADSNALNRFLYKMSQV